MRKHFLLLFLMALLPLAGWAEDYDVMVMPTDASAEWCGGKPDVQAGWIMISSNSGTGNPSKADIAAQLEIKSLNNTNVGEHTYALQKKAGANGYVEVGDDKYYIQTSGSNTATLTITKFTGGVVFNTDDLAFVNDNLFYTSQPQALLSGGATATANGFTVPVVYATSAEATTWVPLDQLTETNANPTGYTVYYKVVGTDNYAGSEVKTMAGTKAIAKADNTISGLALAGWTYDPAKIAEPLATGDNPAITFTATNDAANASFSYKKGTGEYGTWAEKVGGHAGSYTLKATIAESDNYKAGEAEVEFTIAKATPVLNVDGVVNTAWNLYDGGNHNLFLKRATATIGETTLGNTAIYYNARYKAPGGTYGSWFTEKTNPTNSNFTNKKDAGSYQVQIWVAETADYNAVYHKPNNTFVRIDVAQADIPTESYTAPVGKTGLRTTGSNQPLVTAGSWTGATTYGTFKYSLDNSTWGEGVSVGNAAGGYTVYAKIDPTDDVNYKATVFDPIEVTIAAKTTVTIATNANQTFGYGTTPVIEKTVTWADQRGNALDETGLVWKWYDNAECSGDPIALPGTGYYPVGSYYVKADGVVVTAGTGTNPESQEIVYTPALVKITAGQVTAKIKGTATYGSLPEFTLTHVSGLSPAEAASFDAANNLTKVTVKKDGNVVVEDVAPNAEGLKALAVGEYDLEATASCGTNYAVVVTGEKLTVGAKSIATAVIDVTTDANAIVYNNKAWGTVNPIAFTVTETSGIAADDYDVTYSNNVNAGTATITLTGKRNYTGTVTKDFTIKRAALKITANNTNWTYGATEPTYAVTVEGQAEGETALAVGGTLAGIADALTVVRTSNETVGMHAGALVAKFGAAQPAASTNYNITYEAGDLTVGKAAATIQLKADVAATLKSEYGVSNDAAKALIQTALRDINNYEAKSGITAAELASVNVGSVTCDLADEEYQVNGSYSFTATGATSTNYGITIDLEGVYFTVTPAPITLYANDQAIDWSDNDPDNDAADTEVKAATVTIAAGELKYADALTDVIASINIAGTQVGNNNITLTAKDNANYTITVNKDAEGNDKIGNLTVTGAPALALSTADTDLADKLASYNGKTMPVTIDFTARNNRELPAGTARTWTANTWVTLTLPFDISVADLSKALGYAIVNVVDPSKTDVKGNQTIIAAKLTMKGGNGKNDVLAANKPFMVKTADAITGTVNFGNQTIVAPGSDEDALSVNADKNGYVKLIGTYTKKTVSGEDNAKFWFMMGGNYNSWAYIGAGKNASWEVLPFEGYIDMSGVPADARNMTFIFEELDGSTTAIKGISTDELNGKMAEGMYNMNGMKLNTVPTQKGVYIMNGKKVVIK